MRLHEVDAFDAAYGRGVTPADLPPGGGTGRLPTTLRRRRSNTSWSQVVLVAPKQAVALGGLLLTPTEQRQGWVTIAGGTVAAVGARKPSGVRTVATGGVILPGLIDLHGQPRVQRVRRLGAPAPVSQPSGVAAQPPVRRPGHEPWGRLTSAGASSSVKKVMARYAGFGPWAAG